MKRVFTFLFLLFFLLLHKISFAQSSYIHVEYIKVLPALPSVADSIKIITKTMVTSLGNKVSYNHTISNDTIFFEGCYFAGPLTAIAYYTDTTNLGKLNAGNYFVTYKAKVSTDATICTDFGNEVKDTIINVSFATNLNYETTNDFYTVFPNPTKDWFTINANNKICAYLLINIFGEVIDQGNFTNEISIHTQHMPKGIYVIKLMSENNWQSIKIGIE